MNSMKCKLLLLSLCVAVMAGNSWAGIVQVPNALGFNDSVDWCQFGDCTTNTGLNPLLGPQPWVSAGGATGTVGLDGGGPADFTVQFGNLPLDMGAIYNNACCGSVPGPIFIYFDQPEFGVGAFIVPNIPGDFSAILTLFNTLGNPMGSVTANGDSDTPPGGALFLGATSTDVIAFATFSATGGGSTEPDFAIGKMGITSANPLCSDESDTCGTEDEVPEPASLLLTGSVLLGLGALARRHTRG